MDWEQFIWIESATQFNPYTRPSLFGDGPVLTGAFPFRSVSRFPDGIATTKEQAMSIYFIRQSETRIDDDVKHKHTLLATCQPSCQQPLPYCSFDLHCSSPSFSAGKISLVRSVSAAQQ
ncbi:hypothetical protein Tsp_04623 [Trichinella spiralis]|uniref:hypothetical protein n=1 Tax=Trichinella spiralis TaxID=6334 RepID=UPI0001EFD591|nr:hypothetical protein Tsp_04623 [Trichinella spiralis]